MMRVVMRGLRGLLIVPVAMAAVSCGGGGGSSAITTPPVTPTPTNQVAISVEPGPANSVNTLFTSIKVCAPGTSTCQTIDHIQIDTGSSGLRILSSVLSSSITLPIQAAADGHSLVECTQFVDGYSWGPIALADLTIGGESASSVPMQIIGDATFASIVPTACSSTGPAENTVMAFGANGILGVSVFNEDCGPACVTSSAPGFYYSCNTSANPTTCTPTTVALASQLPNPVTLFATNNNGVIITLPSVASGGAATLSGTMIFGIDTQSNNQSGSRTVLTLDSAGDMTTDYNGQGLQNSFFDTGSSGLYFNDSSLQQCSSTGNYKGFYCPTSTQNLTATLQGINLISKSESFSVGNAENEGNAQPSYAVFGDLAGTWPASGGPGVFDWGLPFYFGKTVYTAFEGRTTSGGTGPYVAF